MTVLETQYMETVCRLGRTLPGSLKSLQETLDAIKKHLAEINGKLASPQTQEN